MKLNIIDQTVLATRLYLDRTKKIKSFKNMHQRCIATVIESKIDGINKDDILIFKDREEKDLYYDGVKYVILTSDIIVGKINDQET